MKPRMLNYDEWCSSSLLVVSRHHGMKDLDFYMAITKDFSKSLRLNDQYKNYVDWYKLKYSKLNEVLK